VKLDLEGLSALRKFFVLENAVVDAVVDIDVECGGWAIETKPARYRLSKYIKGSTKLIGSLKFNFKISSCCSAHAVQIEFVRTRARP
jgi:hypothetical protein